MVELPSVCLETDICVDALRARAPVANMAARYLPRSIVWISSVTLAELEFGAALSSRRDARRALARLLDETPVRSFDVRAASAYGRVRQQLEAAGSAIGALDTLIGAHALAEGAVLLTRNVREYRRIAGLTVVDAGATN